MLIMESEYQQTLNYSLIVLSQLGMDGEYFQIDVAAEGEWVSAKARGMSSILNCFNE